jgi:hypothetical protein
MPEQANGERSRPTHLANEQRAAKLMFMAVRHSQGDLDLEGQFLTQAANSHPEWRGQIDVDQACQMFGAKVWDYFADGHHAPVNPREVDVQEQLEDAQYKFRDRLRLAGTEKQYSIDKNMVVEKILDAERIYLFKKDGRPRNVSEKWSSFLCIHGLLGKTTGAWELDTIYGVAKAGVLDLIQNTPGSHETLNARGIISIHAQHTSSQEDKSKLLDIIGETSLETPA